MNQCRSNFPPATPYNAFGSGHPSNQQNVFSTPTGPAADYFNPASARPTYGLSSSTAPSGGGLTDFRQPSFTPVPWENNTGANQASGGFPSSFDSNGPRVGLQVQGGPPRFVDVNYSEGSSEMQFSKNDFPWSRDLVVRVECSQRCKFLLFASAFSLKFLPEQSVLFSKYSALSYVISESCNGVLVIGGD